MLNDKRYGRSTIPPFRGDARRAGGYQNYFLEQPRRGKTREALITPHKHSAVWGLKRQMGSDCGMPRRGKSSVGVRMGEMKR